MAPSCVKACSHTTICTAPAPVRSPGVVHKEGQSAAIIPRTLNPLVPVQESPLMRQSCLAFFAKYRLNIGRTCKCKAAPCTVCLHSTCKQTRLQQLVIRPNIL